MQSLAAFISLLYLGFNNMMQDGGHFSDLFITSGEYLIFTFGPELCFDGAEAVWHFTEHS